MFKIYLEREKTYTKEKMDDGNVDIYVNAVKKMTATPILSPPVY